MYEINIGFEEYRALIKKHQTMSRKSSVWIFGLLYFYGFKCYIVYKGTDGNSECSTRFDHMTTFGGEGKCSDASKMAPICRKGISVAYSEAPPYVTTTKDGTVGGILPGN